jgi:hypothetical protein
LLTLQHPAPILLRDDAVRIVRKTGQHRNLVAASTQALCGLENPSLGRPDLRVEIVAKEQETHCLNNTLNGSLGN